MTKKDPVKRIAIIGGGITGLSLAWQLQQQNEDYRISLFEANDRLGGWISSQKKGGFLFERGPRSCRSRGSGVATLELVEQLGMEKDFLPAHSSVHRRYLYREQKLQELPKSLWGFLTSPLTRSVPLAALCELWRSPGQAPDESVESFFVRRFSRHIAENLVDPMATGIYAGDIKKMSIRSCFPMLYDAERAKGSVIRGLLASRKKKSPMSPFVQQGIKTGIFSFSNGMEMIINRLEQVLDIDIHLQCGVEKVRPLQEGVEVETCQGVQEFDHIFITVPITAMAKMLQDVEGVVSSTQKISKATSVAVVNIGYEGKLLPNEGMGYLIPSKEKERVLGCVFQSSIFPQQLQGEKTTLTMMIGGEHFSGFDNYTTEQFEEIALEAAEKHLGITKNPDVTDVFIAKRSIAQYQIGHAGWIKQLEDFVVEKIPQMTFLGSSYYGVAVNDCITTARDVARGFCNK